MKCERCGKEYWTKECLNCKNQKQFGYTKNETKNNKNIALTITAIGVTIITLIMIANEYKEYKQEQQILKLFYGTTDENKIEKINKKFEQDMKKSMKSLDETTKKFNEDMKKINDKYKNN